MDFNELRKSHPEFVYENFEYNLLENNVLEIKFHFHISPDLDFYPTIKIPVADGVSDIDNFVFNLGMVELISYWKATCSPKVIVKAGKLDDYQIKWWKDLFVSGLGEFFYVNKIDFTDKALLSIEVDSDKEFSAVTVANHDGDMILIGGGKDSAVTGELLKEINSKKAALMLNPSTAAIKTAQIAGFDKQIVVERTIDVKLLELNNKGYLNGHTPFSAYLSFLSALVAHLYGYKNTIVSNEKSAGEGNVEYLGLEINHQYSKSYRYEKLFREYSQKYLSNSLNYFSFLRPLNELQIAALFVANQKYDTTFNSCNVGRSEYWCGECAKCAFVYLIFYGLIDERRRKTIFGEKDFFENEKIQGYIKDLVGEGNHKPLECVGTEEESKMALVLKDNPGDSEILYRIKNDWSSEHFLPEEYEQLLVSKMASLNYE